MAQFDCPGSQQYKQPTPEFYTCPSCHGEIEIWSDEVEVECENCGTPFSRERVQGCIDHCEMARECLGDALYQKMLGRTKS